MPIRQTHARTYACERANMYLELIEQHGSQQCLVVINTGSVQGAITKPGAHVLSDPYGHFKRH